MKVSRKQFEDQTAHFAWSFFALLPVTIWSNPIGGAVSGVLLALPRELWDQRVNLSRSFPWITKGKLLDILFFMLGGFTAGLFF